MPEDSQGSFWRQNSGNIIVSLIGAVGAIGAAIVPIFLAMSPSSGDGKDAPPKQGTPAVAEKGGPVPGAPAGATKEDRLNQAVLRDIARMQGVWGVESLERAIEPPSTIKPVAKKAKPKTRPPVVKSWEIHSTELIVHMDREGSDAVGPRGTITLRRDRSDTGASSTSSPGAPTRRG